MDLVFKNIKGKTYKGSKIHEVEKFNEEVSNAFLRQRDELLKNLKNGFVCKNCRTNNRVVMFINKDKQFEYRCNGCMNKWI